MMDLVLKEFRNPKNEFGLLIFFGHLSIGHSFGDSGFGISDLSRGKSRTLKESNMGLFNSLKNQLIDVIEWLDDSSDTMVYRFYRPENEIMNGARLIVRESQVAAFVNQGQLADVFLPGMHTLATANLPILSKLQGWKYGFQSPFKAEVYFLSTRTFTDRKWGTKNPIMLRDAEFGVVRLRAFGSYAVKVKDPRKWPAPTAGSASMRSTISCAIW
jgi:membrane protease subunit (stomatin/prohibitin family)